MREIRFRTEGKVGVATCRVVAEGRDFLAIEFELDHKHCEVDGIFEQGVSLSQRDFPDIHGIITITNVLPDFRLWSACVPGKWTLHVTFIKEKS